MNSQQLQRHTRQRQVILEELQRLDSHPTAAALYAIVRHRLPKISLGTVYRNLELLARLGMIQKLEFSGGEARFDGNVAQHDHLRCICCGRVDDLSALPLDLSGCAANDCGGYQILGHRLEFFGLCPGCKGLPENSGHGQCDHSAAAPQTSSLTVTSTIPHKPR
jgi:Fur family transcriptional regulator, ferric uptake regulator